MDPNVSPPPAVRWPTPPFFRLAAPATTDSGEECVIELRNGRKIVGELAVFASGADSVGVRVPQRQGIQQVGLAQVGLITLTRPVALLPDFAALAAVGVAERHGRPEKSFTVNFHDGTALSGHTLGFVKEKDGLYLFPIQADPAQATRCFIPTHRFKDVQIGPLLGDTLVDKEIVSGNTLASALDKQSKLRQERIGNYLTDRAIISGDDLVSALREQSKRPNVRLGDILIEANLITAEQLKEALGIQSEHRERRLGDILIEMGAVSVRMIQMALSDKLGIPFVNVREFKIDRTALEAIDAASASRLQVLPLLRTGESVIVAVENPLATDFAQDLRFATGLTIVPVIANPEDIKVRIVKEYAALATRAIDAPSGGTSLGSPEADRPSRGGAPAHAKVEDLASLLAKETSQATRPLKEDAPDARVTDNTLVRLLNKIIIEAHSQGASDIHIESNGGKASTRIRFRKDGDLEDYLELPSTYSNALVSRIKIMAELDISEHRHPQDGKIDFGRHGPLSIELRVAIIPTANNLEDVVLRILGGAEPLPLEQIGFSNHDLAHLKKMISRSYGLILVCGPTGSGKTTTLHSVLRDINRPDIKIWTAEDPIEITQAGLRQVQVHPKIDWTFAAAMRAFLRADPDVIMVGEMRDVETAKIGIEASLTGHLVFSTLHTNSAAETVVRLLDLGMDPFNFADALIGILSQRLARKLCLKCKHARVATETEVADLLGEYCAETRLDRSAVLTQWHKEFGKSGQLLVHDAVGCDACRDGYKGRVVVYELLVGTAQVKHLVRTRASVPQLVEAAQEEGMHTLRQDAIEKVLQGLLDPAAARAVSN